VVLAVIVVALFVPLNGRSPASSPGASGTTTVGGSPLLDKPAPAIALRDLDGKAVTLADYAGRPVLVNIWASWCIPCRAEFPKLVGAYGEYRDQGLEILGIVHDDNADNARAFAQGQGATWPMLLDVDDVVWHDYVGLGVPQSYFIDAAGVVRAFSIGPFSDAGLQAGLDKILPPAPGHS
jgi:cytochrome c biogenesis protein CcmG/thiol:disulfide interchange protein DsbE